MRHRRVRLASVVASATLVSSAMLAHRAYADSTTSWTGGGASADWSDVNNWNPTGAPGYGTLIFQGTAGTTNDNDSIDNMFNIQLTGAGVNWTLGGNTLHFFDFGNAQPKIENRAGASTINFDISFDTTSSTANTTAEINAVNGDLWIGGTVSMTNRVNALNLFGSGNTVTFAGSITGTNNGTSGPRVLNVQRNNTIILQASNSYDGDTSINQGTLSFDLGGSIASDFIRLGDTTGANNAALTLIGNGAQTMATKINVRSGSTGTKAILSSNSAGTNALAGNIFLDDSVTVTETNPGATLALSGTQIDLKNKTMTLTGSGDIVASGSLQNSTGNGVVTKNNTGYLVMSGNNSYTGDTNVNVGTLLYTNSTINNASTIRLGDTAGTNAATLSLGNSDGATFAQTVNVRSGSSGQKTITAANATGTTATYSGHIALDSSATIYSPTAGATIAFTQTHDSTDSTNIRGTDIKGFTLTIDGAGDVVHSGTIYDSVGGFGGITKQGSGALTLSSSNSYSGPTAVNGGTVRLANPRAAGTSAITVSNGTLNFSHITIANTSNLTLNDGATFEASGGASTYTGSINSYPRIASGAGVTLTTATSGDLLTITSAIRNGSTNSVITVNGPGTVVIAGGATTSSSPSAYNGSWVVDGISSTDLKLVDADALGNPGGTSNVLTHQRPITLRNGNLELAVTAGGTYSTSTTIAGNVGVTLSRNASGASKTDGLGNLTVSDGLAEVNSLTLTVSHGSNFTSNNTGSLIFASATLTDDVNFVLNNVNGTGVGVTTVGSINDGGVAKTIGKSGGGALTLSANATSLVDGTALNITGGAVNSNAATALGSLANVTISTGATLNLGASQTLGALNSASGATGAVKLGTNALILGNSVNNLSSSFAGVISGTGAGTVVTKAGSGDLTLSGANTYTGNTSVSAGKLIVANTTGSATGSGNVSVGGSGSLAGTGTISGNTTLASGAQVSPGDFGSAGKLSVANFTLTSGATLQVEVGGDHTMPGITFDQIAVTGSGKTFVVGGANLSVIPIGSVDLHVPYRIVDAGGNSVDSTAKFANLTDGVTYSDGETRYTVSYDTSSIDVTFDSVPEPGSVALVVLAGGSLFDRPRRRRRSACGKSKTF